MAEEVKFIFSMDDQFSAKAKRAEANISNLDNGLSKIGGAVAAAFSVGAVVNFGKAVIDSYSNFEFFHASLKTMFKGDEIAASALEKQLVNLAKTTPFELTEVQDATKKLLAYGFQAGEVVDTMKKLGNVSSGVGAPIGDIAYLYGTLKTSGRVTLMDLRQFAGRGIPIYETLAKRLKTTTAAISGMATDGKIAFKDIEGAFADMTKEGGQFFNLMDDQSKTLGGQISNLKDGWEQFKVSIGTTLSSSLKTTFSFLTNSLNDINEQLTRSNALQGSLTKAGVGLRYGEVKQGAILSGFQQYLDKISADATIPAQNKIVEFQKIAAKLAIQQKTASVLGLKGDNESFLRQIELIKTQIELQKGEQRLKKKTGVSDVGEKIKESTKVKQQQYTNITINIDKLIEDFKVETTTMEKGANGAAEQVVKALASAVNNSQIVAGI